MILLLLLLYSQTMLIIDIINNLVKIFEINWLKLKCCKFFAQPPYRADFVFCY